MSKLLETPLQVEWPEAEQRQEFHRIARERNWGLTLLLIGWLHLAAFSFCYWLTIGCEYHDSTGYLLIWLGELLGVWTLFRVCGGRRGASQKPMPLELFVRRVWIAYFVLAFNLGSLNTLRGNRLFEFFPAIASLAAFAFIVMTVVVDRRFFAAVLVMFTSGLLMAAQFMHAYLIFAVAWWLVLNGIGLMVLRSHRCNVAQSSSHRNAPEEESAVSPC